MNSAQFLAAIASRNMSDMSPCRACGHVKYTHYDGCPVKAHEDARRAELLAPFIAHFAGVDSEDAA